MENIGYITVLLGILNIIFNYDISIKVFLGLELIFIGLSCFFLELSFLFDNFHYLLLAFFFIIIAALESSICLSFLLTLHTEK